MAKSGRTVRKLSGKARLDLLSPTALAEMAKAADHGNQKPGRSPWNWRMKMVKASDQLGGALRHLHAILNGEDFDAGSRAHHAGHVMARMQVFIEAQAQGTLIDDRPPALKRKRSAR